MSNTLLQVSAYVNNFPGLIGNDCINTNNTTTIFILYLREKLCLPGSCRKYKLLNVT